MIALGETLATSGVDIGAGLSAGVHHITVSFQAIDTSPGTDSNGTKMLADQNGKQSWTAEINVTAVPEPASGALILAGLGMIGVVVKRRRVVG